MGCMFERSHVSLIYDILFQDVWEITIPDVHSLITQECDLMQLTRVRRQRSRLDSSRGQ